MAATLQTIYDPPLSLRSTSIQGKNRVVLWYSPAVQLAADMSPLAGIEFKELLCDFHYERDVQVLRSIPTLEKVNGKPSAEFWRDAEVQCKK
jgi:hypothetical protein